MPVGIPEPDKKENKSERINGRQASVGVMEWPAGVVDEMSVSVGGDIYRRRSKLLCKAGKFSSNF